MAGVIATIPKFQFSANGVPMVGGTLDTYIAGSTTPATTWQDSALTIANTNPISLDARGECVLWLDPAVVYKFVLKNAQGVIQWTQDNISGGGSLADRLRTDLAASSGASLVGGGDQVVASIAALRALLKTSASKNAFVTGYYLQGDGGGGAYWYDSTDTTTADNGGTVIVASDGGRWKLRVATFISIKQFGAKGDGATDDCGAIGSTIAYAAQAGKTIYVPFATYRIVPATALVTEQGTETVAFVMQSNMSILADPGATFKLADNQSTDASPKLLTMFGSNAVLSNISFRNLTIDMNGANNKISPSRPTTYNGYNQAHISFSGTNGGGALAARGTDVLIENCALINTAGVSCIVMAQSNTASVTLGKRWTIRNTLFNNNGLDANDHSCVFGWADDVVVEGNTFTSDTAFGTVGSTGMNTAYEIHGGNHRFFANKVKNSIRGVWVSSNYSTNVVGSKVLGNSFETLFYGVDFFRSISTLTPISETTIENNSFIFDDTAVVAIPGLNFKVAVNVSSEYAQQNITCRNNRIAKSGNAITSAAIVITPGSTAGQTHDNIVFECNEGIGLNFGSFIRTSAINGLGAISCKRNNWRDLTPTTAYPSPMGDSVLYTTTPKPITSLALGGGACIDMRGTPQCAYGINLTGAVTNLNMEPSSFAGMVVANYNETALTVTNRTGFYEKVPFTPDWLAGTAITVGNGSVQGAYSIKGDLVTVVARLTVGSTTSFPGGTLSLNLPIASGVSGLQYLGNWRIFDSSASTFVFGGAEVDGTGTSATLQVSGGTFSTQASPVPLAAGDVVSVQITYMK